MLGVPVEGGNHGILWGGRVVGNDKRRVPEGGKKEQPRGLQCCPEALISVSAFDAWGIGSYAHERTGGSVAQRLEQGTHNPLVLGSNPSAPNSFLA